MGSTQATDKCFISDLPTSNIESRYDGIEYSILLEGKNYIFKFLWNFKASSFV